MLLRRLSARSDLRKRKRQSENEEGAEDSAAAGGRAATFTPLHGNAARQQGVGLSGGDRTVVASEGSVTAVGGTSAETGASASDVPVSENGRVPAGFSL